MFKTQDITFQDQAVKRDFNEDDIVLLDCDATDGNITVLLPNATNYNHVIYIVHKSDSSGNTITIDPEIDGQQISGVDSIVLKTQYDNITLVTDNNDYVSTSSVGAGTRVQFFDITPGSSNIDPDLIGPNVDLIIIEFDATDGEFTTVLPDAAGLNSVEIVVKRAITDTSGNNLNITTVGTQKIDQYA